MLVMYDKPSDEIRFGDSVLINRYMGMGEGKFFLIEECQQINIEKGKKIQKSPLGKHRSDG